MVIEFLSIVIFTFALALWGLGAVTWWIERQHKRTLGLLMMGSALLIALGYAFLGSRFSIALFGRLIITVNLPRLMSQAVVYTLGVLLGLGMAGGLFMWISGQVVKPTRMERQLAAFVVAALLLALGVSLLAMQISRVVP